MFSGHNTNGVLHELGKQHIQCTHDLTDIRDCSPSPEGWENGIDGWESHMHLCTIFTAHTSYQSHHAF